MKPRKLYAQIVEYVTHPDTPIVFLWGPRQTGKTIIINALKEQFGGAYFNFDNLEDKRLFVPELTTLTSAVALRGGGRNRMIFIDEVQNHPQGTLAIKLLADSGDYTIVATGSSELRAKTQDFDTLAGRYREYVLFPLTLDEVATFKTDRELLVDEPDAAQTQYLSPFIDEILLYGSYPKVVLSDHKIEEIKTLTRDAVLKDIVNIYHLKNTDLVYDLLRLLAMQIGNLINVTELASSLKTTQTTVHNYLTILAKNRIVYLLEPYRTNARRAYLERRKLFFYDLGVRNALIEDFRPLSLRQDLGALFENLVVMGAWRQIHYRRTNQKLFYFRQLGGSQREIDLIIQSPEGEKTAVEIKYSSGQIHRFPELDIAEYRLVTKLSSPPFLT